MIMLLKIILVIFLSFVILGFNSCQNHPVLPKNAQNELTVSPDTAWKSLTLREKIGQVVCLGYDKNQIQGVGNGSADTFLNKYPVGAMFLANWVLGNSTPPDSLSQLYIKTIGELAKASKTPLLFSEDFETGMGNAMPNFTLLPAEMGLGATQSIQYAHWYGDMVASELRSIGLNWILNPVADLNMNPFNHLVNVRSVGDHPEKAAKMLSSQVIAMQKHHLAATAKHFPGDGTDFINQHFCTSQMKLSYSEWQKTFGLVYKQLIDDGIMAIMAGHITFPGYQKELWNGEYLPATLSPELLKGLLKGTLGFGGVIVSDALNMAGIAGYFPNQLETEIACFNAGCDILLWPSLEFMDTLEARIVRKEMDEDRLNDAVSRVWNMKRKLGLFDKGYQIFDTLSKEEFQDHSAKATEITQKSMTLLSDKNNLLPLDTSSSKKILLCVVSGGDQQVTFIPFKEALTAKGFEVDIRSNLSFFTHGHELNQLSATYDKFIFIFNSNPANPWGSLDLRGDGALTVWSANKLPHEKVISIAFGNPYENLGYMQRTWCRINCYSADKQSQKILVDGIIGGYEFTGVLPVRVP
jgi:beta-N-acetylhexosaminidase